MILETFNRLFQSRREENWSRAESEGEATISFFFFFFLFSFIRRITDESTTDDVLGGGESDLTPDKRKKLTKEQVETDMIEIDEIL